MIVQAILVGLIAAWGSLDYAFGTLYTFRPIVLGPLVGLALGDVKTGVEIGASLELLFMGAISVGAYIPPEFRQPSSSSCERLLRQYPVSSQFTRLRL